MKITPEIRDAINNYVLFTKIQMGIIEPILVYYSWEEVEHLNYPISPKIHYNKLLGWTDKINGNRVLLVNVRMHQNFMTLFRTITHELFHVKFPHESDESRIEIFAMRWLETKHDSFGFFHDEKFQEGW